MKGSQLSPTFWFRRLGLIIWKQVYEECLTLLDTFPLLPRPNPRALETQILVLSEVFNDEVK
jgi:hypothetical protein